MRERMIYLMGMIKINIRYFFDIFKIRSRLYLKKIQNKVEIRNDRWRN